jgi:NAD(P)-dependent dehydrogenase (short-subunit alcohol dehydrogenase family)
MPLMQTRPRSWSLKFRAAGGRAIAKLADVAEAAAVEALVSHTEKELGPVTPVINFAAFGGYPRDVRWLYQNLWGRSAAFAMST